MRKTVKKTFAIVSLIVSMALWSADGLQAQEVVRKDMFTLNPDSVEHVIVGGDTVSVIIPERNFGRYHRGLFNYLIIPRGKWGFGLTASYGEIVTDDTSILSLLTKLDMNVKTYSIKPYLSYFIKHNQSVGLRFNYTRGIFDLGNLSVDFDEDLNFSVSDVSYYSQSFATSIFYRNYIGIGNTRRFAIFNEVDLEFSSGSSRFNRIYNGEPKNTRTNVTKAALNFSPGVCVFIQEYVAATVSFGVFGLNMRKERQWTDGIEDGSRFTSGANFRFNIFNINFGLMVVI